MSIDTGAMHIADGNIRKCVYGESQFDLFFQQFARRFFARQLLKSALLRLEALFRTRPNIPGEILEGDEFLAVTTLYHACFLYYINEFLIPMHKSADDVDYFLSDTEISNALDDGHRAWFLLFRRLKKIDHSNDPRGVLDLDLAMVHDWYLVWKPWFEEHYPQYFSEVMSTKDLDT